MVIPGWDLTSASASLERVPEPRGRPRRPAPVVPVVRRVARRAGARRVGAAPEGPDGATPSSAANAAIDHVHDWVRGTTDGDWVSMAVPSDGSYGVEEGLISGFPVTCSGGEWKVVEGLDIPDFSRERIDRTVAELKEERDAVLQLSLI